MSALVTVRDLAVSFRLDKSNTVPAVRGVSFDIPENTTVALVGESGSGKSVTALSLMRLLPDNAVIGAASRIEFAGRELLAAPESVLRALRGKDISFVFQEPMSSLNPVFTVGDQIAEVLQLHLKLSRRAALDRTLELLQEVGIPEPRARLSAYPHELSGGQQQRVMIAMAMACEPKLLIADEPTTALDVTVQRQILDLLARLQERRRMSVLFISHDLAVVGEVADQVIVMKDGLVRETASVERIFSAPADAYTRALLACRPRVDVKPRRLPVVEDFIRENDANGGTVFPPLQGAPGLAGPSRSTGESHATRNPCLSPQSLSRGEREVKSPSPTGRGVGVREEVPQSGTSAPNLEAPTPLIEVRHLSKEYRLKTGLFSTKSVLAAQGVSFDLYRGRTLGVEGESGSGKTTVGLLLTRLIDATAGSVKYQGQDLLQLSPAQLLAYRKKIQIIFQNPYASLNPRFTVGQILTEPMQVHGIGANDHERFEQAAALAAKVGLSADALAKYPHEFSGGQRQRIAIARVLGLQPDVIICDESVSALDVSVQATVLNLLLDLQDEFNLSYIFISHDLAVVKYMADDILVMNQGQVVERGAADAVYAAPAHEYTRKLLGAIPRGFQG